MKAKLTTDEFIYLKLSTDLAIEYGSYDQLGNLSRLHEMDLSILHEWEFLVLKRYSKIANDAFFSYEKKWMIRWLQIVDALANPKFGNPSPETALEFKDLTGAGMFPMRNGNGPVVDFLSWALDLLNVLHYQYETAPK